MKIMNYYYKKLNVTSNDTLEYMTLIIWDSLILSKNEIQFQHVISTMQAKIEEYDRDKENFLLNAKNLFKVLFP